MKDKYIHRLILLFIFLNLILYSSHLFFQQSYLMVVDIQEFPKKNKMLEESVQEMILNVNTLLGHYKNENVIYIKAQGKALNLSLKGFSVVALPAPPFDSALNVVSEYVFTKVEGDAFSCSKLNRFLEEKKVKRIALVGLLADHCLLKTDLGGIGKGYNITIVPEGVIGITPKKKGKALKK